MIPLVKAQPVPEQEHPLLYQMHIPGDPSTWICTDAPIDNIAWQQYPPPLHRMVELQLTSLTASIRNIAVYNTHGQCEVVLHSATWAEGRGYTTFATARIPEGGK